MKLITASLGERYHQPLRQIYRKIMSEHSQTPPERALTATVKAMNDTLGPEGLVTSAIVFGEFPRGFTKSETPSQRPTLEERAPIAQSARKEMGKIMAEMRIRLARVSEKAGEASINGQLFPVQINADETGLASEHRAGLFVRDLPACSSNGGYV